MWDDTWDPDGFDFELTFTTDDPEPGRFCQSAIPVPPGEHLLDAMDGDAAVAGPDINNTSASTTNYSKSKWYSFTPTANGTMIISSCEGAGSDTHVFVYTGDCTTFEGLNLEGQNDNGANCPQLQSELSLEVTAGTTYLIEWIDRWDPSGFFWYLIFDPDAAEITFQVDMSMENVTAGVFLAGDFSGWENVAMNDDDMDGVFTAAIPLSFNSTQEYRFKNGPDELESIVTSVGEDCTTGATGNRELIVGEENITLDVVCYSYCVACELVGIDEATLAQGIRFFPNPATEILNVQFDLPEATEDLKLRMTNTLGMIILDRYLGTLQNDQIELDLATLATGAYFLQVTDGKNAFTRKIVVE